MANKLIVEGMQLRVWQLNAGGVLILIDEDGGYYHTLLNPKEYADQQALATAALAAAAAPAVSTGKTYLPVTVSDTIQLRATGEKANTLLAKCGTWWKVMSGHAGGTPVRPHPQWFLKSLDRKQQGLPIIKGFTFENLWINKQDDPQFEIVRVCPCPKEFNYKEYS